MRIQHNIAAMNSYRNYSNNVSSVNKNLEKLSSGYKINRAGDDAAGLAISEKMRAQIKGLEAAQKNVKDGTSLVKTAEGAMQEIHDMLDRMKYLATQSANGTYDNAVDRDNLNKEVNALKTEIDRIADSANFNGIKLLDGSLESPSGAIMVKSDAGVEQNVTSAGAKFSQTLTIVGTSNGNSSEVGKQGTLEIAYLDKDGAARSNTISYTIAGSAAETAKNMVQGIKDMFGGDYNVSLTGAAIKIEAAAIGEDKTRILSAKQYDSSGVILSDDSLPGDAGILDDTGYTAGEDALYDVTGLITANMKFEVDGTKFQVVQRGSNADAGYTALYVDEEVKNGTALQDVSNKQIIDQLKANGVSATDGSDGANDYNKVQLVKSTGKGGGLTLQIGDTADSYNQMKVGIHDMHSSALGIAAVDISTQGGAAAAIDKINDAINTVSSTRGDLGALQNRLDHTLNNLSVMTENIQDAESTIRDTDVADEMMAYTKNNILVQSAQAMLAQANQIPQGVLQLLG